jgi:hypothetical protein
LEEENEELKERLTALEFAPGGPEFQEAKAHFDSIKTGQI